MDEEHLWLSTQTFTVKVVKILDNIKNADWLGIACEQHSKLAVSEEATDKSIKVGMVATRETQQRQLNAVHRHVAENLHIKLQLLK